MAADSKNSLSIFTAQHLHSCSSVLIGAVKNPPKTVSSCIKCQMFRPFNPVFKNCIYLPLLDHRAHLVTSQVHAMEVGQAVLALHILSDELELAESNLIVLQVSKAHLEHTTLQPIRGNS